jgi:TM2 domain-containing membrane protein YozV
MEEATKQCPHCGETILLIAKKCKHCGELLDERVVVSSEPKNSGVAIILCHFLGAYGIHRFYTGYIGVGIAQLLTCGGFGIWVLVDWVSLLFDEYKDTQGRKLANYGKTVPIISLSIMLVALYLMMLIVLFTMFAGLLELE